MGGFANTFNTPTGVQTNVSGASGMYPGMPGGMDMSWLMDLARRRAAQKLQAGAIQNQSAAQSLADQQRASRIAQLQRGPAQFQGPADANSPYGPNSAYAQGMRYRSAAANLPEQTPAQRAVGMAGGMTGQAYSDMARQMMAGNMATQGTPTTPYEGWTRLTEAALGSPAGAAAVSQAGQAQQQMADMNSPLRQQQNQIAMAARMYPGMYAAAGRM